MSEALVYIHDEQPTVETWPRLQAVPDIALPYGSESYVGPAEDDNGKVTRPAMLVQEAIMPNGQRVNVFYDRGSKRSDADEMTDIALSKAARILTQMNK